MKLKMAIFAVLLAMLLPAVLAEEECKTSTNERGCVMTTCTDVGTGEVIRQNEACPYDDSGDEPEENLKTEGSEGLGLPQPLCKERTDEKGCIIKECFDEAGTVISQGTPICPGETESCGSFTDDAGCTIMTCKDSTGNVVREDKSCPEKPPETGEEQEVIEEAAFEYGEEETKDSLSFRQRCIAKGGTILVKKIPRGTVVFRKFSCVRIKVGPVVSTIAKNIIERAEAIQDELRKCKKSGGVPAVVEEFNELGQPFKRVICKGVEGEPEIAQVPETCSIVLDEKTGLKKRVCLPKVGQEVSTAAQVPRNPNCPPINEQKLIDCQKNGGRPAKAWDEQGCAYVECKMGEEEGFAQQCPTGMDIENQLMKCKKLVLVGVVNVGLNGCKFVKCMEATEGGERLCPQLPTEELHAVKKSCDEAKQSMKMIEKFDENGCPAIPECVTKDIVCEPTPEEAYKKCEEAGGKLVIQEDKNGCARIAQCVKRGDYAGYNPEEVKEVPSAAKLLSAALKLEDLRIGFEKLAKKTAGIADYYESTGDTANAEKFMRVSGMFTSATEKVDELKKLLRDKSRGMTLEDFRLVKERIQYVKEELLQNILYVMLSDPEEITTKLECGTSGDCFSKALGVCQPATFAPQYENAQAAIEIIGIDENKACQFKGSMTDDTGAYEMDCRLKDYAFGQLTREDMPNICTGSMTAKLPELQESGSPQPEEFDELDGEVE